MTQKCAEPGGHLFLREPDILSYDGENPPPPVLQESDIRVSFQGTSNIAKINRIFIGEALKRGFVAG